MNNQKKVWTSPGFIEGHTETLENALIKAAYHGLGKVTNTITGKSIAVRSAQRAGTITQRISHAKDIAKEIISAPSYKSAWQKVYDHYCATGYTKSQALDKVYDLNNQHGEQGLIELAKTL